MNLPNPTPTQAAYTICAGFAEFETLLNEGLPRDQIFGACLLYNAMLRRVEPFIPATPEFDHVRSLMDTIKDLTFGIYDYNARLKGQGDPRAL